ncbi:hypothetical protein [Paenibacillus alginolyticus]|uniref:Atg14 domain-containing protein n=1 Tax=Paenibacillus alginolyticus TaxID=59839 RepID=A0ABT4GFV0_9BACL|nr:hypothetical protein [Paenibacillus alginolyticus]MCY9695059.1 Atg14 domain-containing protein [Paenibacillus alginolyticus]MEC0145471.1 hypothetical protein [Paenibacillus alginolyticus]
MDNQVGKLKNKWFGLKKSDVRQEIRRLGRLQNAELESLMVKKNELQKERARLLEQRNELLQKNEGLPAEDKLRQLAIERLPDAIHILQQFAEEENNAIQNFRAKVDQDYENKTIQLKHKAQRYSELTQDLLRELASLIEQLRDEGWQELEESIVYTIAAKSLEAKRLIDDIGLTKPNENLPKTDVDDQDRAVLPQRAESRVKLAQVIQFRARSIVDKYAKQLVTADGLTLLHEQSLDQIEASSQPNTKDQPMELTIIPTDLELKEISMSSMEQATANELSSVLVEPSSQPEITAPLCVANETRKRSKFWSEVEEFVHPVGIQMSTSSIHNTDSLTYSATVPEEKKPSITLENLKVSKMDKVQSAEQLSPSTSEGSGSPVLDEEIMAIRSRYIVGKTAGEDLIAPNGQRLISRGEMITSEVVALADRHGKLPELIVNMTITGVGDA